jgi:hypothetical protein
MPQATTIPRPRKVYSGNRDSSGCLVVVTTTDAEGVAHSRLLEPHHDLQYHAPGFDWGQDDAGAAQLALAILADHLKDGPLALALHAHLKQTLVARLPRRAWALGEDALDRAVGRLRR